METIELLKKYTKFYNNLKKLGDYPLEEVPMLKKIGINPSLLQSCYQDIKELKNNDVEPKFRGNILDYLCWISTNYILMEWEKRLDEGLDWFKTVCGTDIEMAKNMVRLFFKDSSHVLYSEPAKNFKNNKELHLTICELHWEIITKKK